MSMSGYAFDALMPGKAILFEQSSLIPLKQSMAIDRCSHSYFASTDRALHNFAEQSHTKEKKRKDS